MPGVFAIGDVRNGSMSRFAAAVGEGSAAARLIHELFAAERLTAGAAWRIAEVGSVFKFKL